MKNILVLSSLLILFACNSTSTQETSTIEQNKTVSFAIDKPNIAEIDKVQSFTISASEGDVINTNKQSVIVIPKDAFMYEDGTSVEGEVKVEFEEFYGVADIIKSGIPMTVMVNGEPTPFISDGMFDISATCQGKKLEVKKDKEIEVFTKSEKKDKSFKYWFFNKVKGAWENLGPREKTLAKAEVKSRVTQTNIRGARVFNAQPPSVNGLANKELVEPTPPIKMKAGEFTFSVSGANIKSRDISAYKNVIWKPETKLSVSEQDQLVNDLENNGASPVINCLNENDQLFQLRYFGNKTIKMRPILIGKDKKMAQAKFQKRVKRYEEQQEKEAERIRESQRKAEALQATYNYFNVKKMGIYNCDRFYTYKGTKKDYVFKNRGKKVEQFVYAILKGSAGVIALSKAYLMQGKFKLPKKEVIGFIHTGEDGKLYATRDEGVNDGNLEFTFYSNKATSENLDELINSFE